jgi:hypothetical protein
MRVNPWLAWPVAALTLIGAWAVAGEVAFQVQQWRRNRDG